MDDIRIKLTTIPQCFVYRLGPRPSAKGYMCKDWPQEDHVWTGKVVIYSKGSQCIVSLEDPKTGTLFASAPVTEDGPGAIERAIDSSRYFIIRVDDGAGHHAFIGVGFETREEGFDFMHTIGEHFRRVRDDKEAKTVQAAPRVETDYSLKGKIKVDLKLKPTSAKPATTAGPSTGFFPPPDSNDSAPGFPAPPASSSANTATQVAPVNSFFGAPAPAPATSSPSSSVSNDFFSMFGAPSGAPVPASAPTSTFTPVSAPAPVAVPGGFAKQQPQSFFGAPAPAPVQTAPTANAFGGFFGAPTAAPAPAPAPVGFPQQQQQFAPQQPQWGQQPQQFAPQQPQWGQQPQQFAPQQPQWGQQPQQFAPQQPQWGQQPQGYQQPQTAFGFPGQVPVPVQQQSSVLDQLGIKW